MVEKTKKNAEYFVFYPNYTIFGSTNITTMSNKRDLKRAIRNVCTELFAEGVAVSLYGSEKNKEVIEPIFVSILEVHSDYTRRVSFPEPGIKPKKYYKFVIEEFNKQVAEIADQLAALQ